MKVKYLNDWTTPTFPLASEYWSMSQILNVTAIFLRVLNGLGQVKQAQADKGIYGYKFNQYLIRFLS